jgi:pyruvate/2-oxoglutarate dehydrogenase complex dihydrolipoamide dehydrogenase (E3) component
MRHRKDRTNAVCRRARRGFGRLCSRYPRRTARFFGGHRRSQLLGRECLNAGCIPSKSPLRNAEIAHVLRADADKFGFEGAITMRYDAAFERSRQVAVELVRGLRFLLRKNNIDEYEGQGIFVDRHTSGSRARTSTPRSASML